MECLGRARQQGVTWCQGGHMGRVWKERWVKGGWYEGGKEVSEKGKNEKKKKKKKERHYAIPYMHLP